MIRTKKLLISALAILTIGIGAIGLTACSPDVSNSAGNGGNSILNVHTHEYTWQTTKSATCTVDGEESFMCACGEIMQTRKSTALGHDVIERATCTSLAVCSRCGEFGKTTAHSLVQNAAKEATCDEIGWNAYVSCGNCTYTTYEEIAATGHILKHYEHKEPTCTDAGHPDYFGCEKCDLNNPAPKKPTLPIKPSYADFTVDKYGEAVMQMYEFAMMEYENAMVQYNDAKMEYEMYCQEFAARGHEMMPKTEEYPMCGEGDGIFISEYCWSCWEEWKIQNEYDWIGDPLQCHLENYSWILEEAQAKGILSYVIIVGYDHYYGDTFVPGKAATCTEDGYTWSGQCLYCGWHQIQMIIPRFEHDMNYYGAENYIGSTPATCLQSAYCARCETYWGKPLGDGAHQWSAEDMVVLAQPATCVSVGWTEHHYCIICKAPAADYQELPIVECNSTQYGSCASMVECNHSYYDWKDHNYDGVQDEDEVVWFGCGALIPNTDIGDEHEFGYHQSNYTCYICGKPCEHEYIFDMDKDGYCVHCGKWYYE